MNVSSGFGRERPAPRGSFGSPVGPQFHSTFQTPNGHTRLDRPDGRPFTDFSGSILPQEQLMMESRVIDSDSGKILVPPSRSDQEQDPISRFYNGDNPWNPQGINNTNSYPPTFITQGKNTVVRPHAPYPGYREPARSNPDSHITGRQQPDSGYVTTGPGTKSVVSGGETFEPSDDNHSFIDGMETMQLQTNASIYSGSTQTAASIQQNFTPWQEPEHEVGATFMCSFADCKDETRFKNASELRKHQQRHEKPHKCNVQGCTRKEGFTTKNDLDRHKKSIHGISLPHDRSFRCAGLQCNKRGKVWPRLDNFKSHCHRMHSKEDIDELIKRSEIEQERLTTLQSVNGHAIPANVSPYTPTEGCIQDANLLLDLSQGAPQSQNSYPNSARGLGMNRIISTLPVPALQPPRVPSERNGTNRVEPIMAEPTEKVRKSPFQQDSRQFAAANNQFLPSNVETAMPTPTQPSSAQVFGKGQTETSSTKTIPNSNLLVSRTELEDCARQLVLSVTRELELPSAAKDRVSMIIHSNIKKFASSLGPGRRPMSADDLAGMNGEPGSRPKRVRCRICSKTMDRPCDLKKHEKRHSRPWGCTDAGCNKTFGSKNDWKRHENSQHYQLETWRCHESVPTSKIGTCAKIFYRRDPFQGHLRRDHSVRDEDYIRDQCRKRRIGRNWQNGFWCGFCKAIVKLSTRGLEAWDERFNHIDDCHFKQGQNIDDWYPMDKDVPKGKLKDLQHRHPHRRRGLSGDDYGGGGDGESVRESMGDGDGDRDGVEGEDEEDDESEPDLDRSDDSEVEDYPVERTKRRRSYNDHRRGDPDGEGALGNGISTVPDSATQREATPKVPAPTQWFCAHCDYGPMRTRMTTACDSCGKRMI